MRYYLDKHGYPVERIKGRPITNFIRLCLWTRRITKKRPRCLGPQDVTVTITMTCRDRWIPQVLTMLKHMERLGDLGASREVGIMADGDGDFRPKFKFSTDYDPVKPVGDDNGNVVFDAG